MGKRRQLDEEDLVLVEKHVLDHHSATHFDLSYGTPLDPHQQSVQTVFAKNPVGRPSLYTQDFDEVVKSLHMLGSSVTMICGIMRIAEQTYYNWVKMHPSFAKAILEGRELADAAIVRSLYHRAKGYSHLEDKIHFTKDGDALRETVVKHYPPDTQAGIYWLNNRQRRSGNWKSTVDVTTTEVDGRQVDPTRPPLINIKADPTPGKD